MKEINKKSRDTLKVKFFHLIMLGFLSALGVSFLFGEEKMTENKIRGIYKIENLKNGKIYVGQSVNIRKRFHVHKSTLINRKHINEHLQRSFNRDGMKNFKFSVLEEVKDRRKSLTKREQYWIDFYKSFRSVYNQRPIENSTIEYKHSKESREKISKGRLKYFLNHEGTWQGKKHTKETRKRMSTSAKNLPERIKNKQKLGQKKYFETHPGPNKGKKLGVRK